MRPREFARYLARDLSCVCGCTGREDTLIPHHRANRGHGGSKLLDRPSNILTLCSHTNGLLESDPVWAATARDLGWKLARWQTPEEAPFYDRGTGEWYVLDNDYSRRPACTATG